MACICRRNNQFRFSFGKHRCIPSMSSRAKLIHLLLLRKRRIQSHLIFLFCSPYRRWFVRFKTYPILEGIVLSAKKWDFHPWWAVWHWVLFWLQRTSVFTVIKMDSVVYNVSLTVKAWIFKNFCFWCSIILEIRIIHSKGYISSKSDLFRPVWGVLNGFVDIITGRDVDPDLKSDNDQCKKQMALLVANNFWIKNKVSGYISIRVFIV